MLIAAPPGNVNVADRAEQRAVRGGLADALRGHRRRRPRASASRPRPLTSRCARASSMRSTATRRSRLELHARARSASRAVGIAEAGPPRRSRRPLADSCRRAMRCSLRWRLRQRSQCGRLGDQCAGVGGSGARSSGPTVQPASSSAAAQRRAIWALAIGDAAHAASLRCGGGTSRRRPTASRAAISASGHSRAPAAPSPRPPDTRAA